jgi:acyl-CoA dehydrogenase
MTSAFDVSSNVTEVVERTRAFIRDVVIPVEDANEGDIERAGGESVRFSLQGAAREVGLLSPHMEVEYGGGGLVTSMVDRAPVFEEAGYSLFGGLALNVAAPEEGNMHLLAHVATPEQKEQYLLPLVAGDVRSAFAMTEPAPGAGSDPAALTSSAHRVAGGWSINGSKTFITGADGASFFIVMARTSGEVGEAGGATMFLVPADTAGVTVGRHIKTLESSMLGGHCDVTFEEVLVPDESVLGDIDRGFANAQVRLGPARMTHVMRWLGAARRAHEVAVQVVSDRELFGSRLSDLGLMQQMIADNEIDLVTTRAVLMQACWQLDQGDRSSTLTSIAKVYGSEAVFRIVDRAVQMCGGHGVSEDLPIARISREVRPFRIYDGPSEVHRWSVARAAVRRIAGAAK